MDKVDVRDMVDCSVSLIQVGNKSMERVGDISMSIKEVDGTSIDE